MGVENKKSTAITKRDSVPSVPSSTLINGGRLRQRVGLFATAAADDDNSVFRVVQVNSWERIDKLEILADAITGGTDFDIGIYDTAEEGGAVVDADFFADTVDLSSAKARTDVTYERAATRLTDIEKPLWEQLGLSEDPKKAYDIALTGNTLGSGVGDGALVLTYVDGT